MTLIWGCCFFDLWLLLLDLRLLLLDSRLLLLDLWAPLLPWLHFDLGSVTPPSSVLPTIHPDSRSNIEVYCMQIEIVLFWDGVSTPCGKSPKMKHNCNYIFHNIQSLVFSPGCHNDCLDAMRIREVGKYPSCEPANKKMWACGQNCRHYFENHIPSSHFWSEHPRLKSNLSTPMRLFIWAIDFTQR